MNYCEICYEPHKSRGDLYDHYRSAHINSYDLGSEKNEIVASLQQQQESRSILSSGSFLGHSLSQDNLILINGQTNKSLEMSGADLTAVLNEFVLTDQELDKGKNFLKMFSPSL